MDLSLTLHKNRPVCFYLVVQRVILRAAALVFLATACPGDALVPTSRVARVRRASGPG